MHNELRLTVHKASSVRVVVKTNNEEYSTTQVECQMETDTQRLMSA